jgi:hypothetical protein
MTLQIRSNEKAIEEMQGTNYSLSERLENVYRSMSLSPHHQTGNMSLLNEMEMSDSEKSLNASRRPFSQIDEDEDVECDNPEIRITNDLDASEVRNYIELIACIYCTAEFHGIFFAIFF